MTEKCEICNEEATKVIIIDNLYGSSNGIKIYLCEDHAEDILDLIENRIREENPKFRL
jgi:hypothetical protein